MIQVKKEHSFIATRAAALHGQVVELQLLLIMLLTSD